MHAEALATREAAPEAARRSRVLLVEDSASSAKPMAPAHSARMFKRVIVDWFMIFVPSLPVIPAWIAGIPTAGMQRLLRYTVAIHPWLLDPGSPCRDDVSI